MRKKRRYSINGQTVDLILPKHRDDMVKMPEYYVTMFYIPCKTSLKI